MGRCQLLFIFQSEAEFREAELDRHLTVDIIELSEISDQLTNLASRIKKNCGDFITISLELSKQHIEIGSICWSQDIRQCRTNKQEDTQKILLTINTKIRLE